MGSHILGTDIGGTFTDLVALDTETGVLKTVKVPTTIPKYIDGVMNAVKQAGISPSEIALFKHGSTVGTNAITQRTGAATGLVTTQGFRDVLIAARSDRSSQYDLWLDLPAPLVPRRHILTVDERVDFEGSVVKPLNTKEAAKIARIFKKRGIKSIAICFINSFMNPVNEYKMRKVINQVYPEAFVSVSYDISPEIREFERTSTTVVNAYIGPAVSRYLETLSHSLERWGYKKETLITHSGGGVMSVDSAKTIPSRMILASRAAGVIGGAYLGRVAGLDNVVTFEMGGTTTDVSLVKNGRPSIADGMNLDLNIVVRFPAVDTVTIGAGGGSIAWIDSGGILRVGPHSAQAVPGPACYGTGGTEPTITDAMLALGRLNEKMFLGGAMKIKKELSIEAIDRVVGKHLHLSWEEAAEGIIEVARSNITNALSIVSVERGNDPREFAMVAFGGAGPLIAAYVARDLYISKVMIPRYPGLNSPIGILGADVRHDFIRPIFQLEANIDIKKLNRSLKELTELAESTLRREGLPEESMRFERYLDVRVYGQPYRYLTLPFEKEELTLADVKALIHLYNEKHLKEFGYVLPPVAEVEIANARIAALGSSKRFEPQRFPKEGKSEDALKGSRSVYFKEAGGYVATNTYDRGKLKPGAEIAGPSIVEQMDSTVVVPPGFKAGVDEFMNIILEVA